ncbi:MAG: hypothetical protein QOK40_836, partial [Miltoncostaeaceae bacterium]|nr:hypothetical protein [Miltoncostaeaceae bacterium]
MPHHALLRPRRRALPALAALIACAALSGAPGSASAADPGLTLTALSPASWWQADGTFRVPLRLEVGELITIDHLEIEVVGLPGVITVAAPAGLVSVLEGAGLSIDLPGVAGNRTIRVTAFVVGQPSYG